MDISESGRQIGEKLFALLDTEQQKDLLQYILNRENLSDFPDIFLCTVSKCHGFQNGSVQPLLEIREGDLYFCLEERTVCVGSQDIAAIEKWDRRRKKINYDNLFVEMYSERADIIERFLALNNYKKKLCFVTFQSDHPNLFTLDTKQRELWEVVNESSQYYLIDLLNGRKKTRYR